MKSVSVACLKRFERNSDLLLIGNGYTYQGGIKDLRLVGDTLTTTFEHLAARTPAIDFGLAAKPITILAKGNYWWQLVTAREYVMTFDGIRRLSIRDDEFRIITQRGEFIILLAEGNIARLNYAALFQLQTAET